MTIQSMTGFARLTGEWNGFVWTWEVKSVNGKGLDVRVRVPAQIDGFDVKCRQKLAKAFRRGSIFANLSLQSGPASAVVVVNRQNLDQLLAVVGELGAVDGVDPPRLDGLLRVKGVVEVEEGGFDEKTRAGLEDALLEGLEVAAQRLIEARQLEGAALRPILEELLADFETETSAASACAAAQPAAIRDRLKAKIDDVLVDREGLDSGRIEHEVALLAVKADVREELDRLSGHIVAARELIVTGGPVGRKLDFLCQEFNREANTLTSKSPDMDLTQIGLALKALVDQFREQVQNIE